MSVTANLMKGATSAGTHPLMGWTLVALSYAETSRGGVIGVCVVGLPGEYGSLKVQAHEVTIARQGRQVSGGVALVDDEAGAG